MQNLEVISNPFGPLHWQLSDTKTSNAFKHAESKEASPQ